MGREPTSQDQQDRLPETLVAPLNQYSVPVQVTR